MMNKTYKSIQYTIFGILVCMISSVSYSMMRKIDSSADYYTNKSTINRITIAGALGMVPLTWRMLRATQHLPVPSRFKAIGGAVGALASIQYGMYSFLHYKNTEIYLPRLSEESDEWAKE